MKGTDDSSGYWIKQETDILGGITMIKEEIIKGIGFFVLGGCVAKALQSIKNRKEEEVIDDEGMVYDDEL